MSLQRKALRKLLAEPGPILAPSAYDALSARAIESVGYKLCSTTGYGMHGVMLGKPDTGLLCLNETCEVLGKMVNAINIPMMADAEGGYGSAMNVIRTIQDYEQTGIAGLFIEDQKQPPNCPFIKAPEVVSMDEMIGKIHAAIDTRQDPDMVIVARTDAPYEEAIERANAYLEAGADMVKVLPKTRKELEEIPKRVHGPLHLGMYANKGINDGLTYQDVGDMGYKIVTYPMSCLFAQTAALLDILQYMKEHGTDEGYLNHTMQFSEYLKFIGADEYKASVEKYIRD